MLKNLIMTILAGAILALPSHALSAPKMDLSTRAEVEVVVLNEEGEKETRLIAASDAEVVPGDTVIITTQFRNIGDEPTDPGIKITNPVPDEMSYIGGSAYGEGAEITFSVVAGSSKNVPEKLFIKDPDGSKRKALARDYTDIRWKVLDPLAPSANGAVGFRAKVK